MIPTQAAGDKEDQIGDPSKVHVKGTWLDGDFKSYVTCAVVSEIRGHGWGFTVLTCWHGICAGHAFSHFLLPFLHQLADS